MTQGYTLADLMREDEEAALAKARQEIAGEKQAWADMTPEQREAQTAAYEAKYANFNFNEEEEE